jgi:amino acid transporter
MAMSRDGLLPKVFSSIHPKFKTPWFATIVTGLVVAIPALFMNLTEVTDLASIGTLFAFLVVCAGVLFKDKEFGREKRYVPYIPAEWIFPALVLLGIALFAYFADSYTISKFFTVTPEKDESWMSAFSHKIPTICFLILTLVMVLLSNWKKLSLIPVLGVMSCAYLMTELGVTNWMRFSVWLLFGLAIYFGYSYSNSNLREADSAETVNKGSLKLASIGFLIAAIGLSISAFDFINNMIVSLIPSLDGGILKTVEIAFSIIGLLMGIFGALTLVKKK